MNERTVAELQDMLEKGKTSSEQLIRDYLHHIEMRNPSLNALGDVNHHAIFEARALDSERRQKGKRSRLHGIPILVKDNILTYDTMRTTANAKVFESLYAPYDATIIKKLRAAGAIILAKASLSEFAYYMSKTTMPSGFGALFGQVAHPYDKTVDPLGSSTGSAVGVAADLAPVSIGTETNGSLISPATANSIVSIKPTLGLVSRHGIIPVSSMQDTAGPMSKTVLDCAIVLDLIKGHDEHDATTSMIPTGEEPDYVSACHASIEGLRIGLLNFKGHEPNEETLALQKEAKEALESLGATVKPLVHDYDLPDNTRTLTPEMHRDMNVFLNTLKGYSHVESLLDLIRYNHADRRRRVPHGQGRFIEAQGCDHRLSDPDYLKARRETDQAVERFIKLFETHDVDVLMTTKITGYAPVGGLPVITVPAEAFKNKMPTGMLFIGRHFDESTLFKVASNYERLTGKRVPPVFSTPEKS